MNFKLSPRRHANSMPMVREHVFGVFSLFCLFSGVLSFFSLGGVFATGFKSGLFACVYVSLMSRSGVFFFFISYI